MTPTAEETPRALKRTAIGGAAVIAALLVFKGVPHVVELGPVGHIAWLAAFQIGGLCLAFILSVAAARIATGASATAWKYFAVGLASYLLGNLYVLNCMITEYTPPFPSVTELSYFVMAGAFAMGMANFGEVSQKITRTNVYNFVLVYCAITIACLFIMRPEIENSTLGRLGTLVAILYPALWFSVAAFGIMALTIYRHGNRSIPFKLLVAAVTAEAVADMFYARSAISGTYIQGGTTEFLWVSSIAFSVWAAADFLLGRGLSDHRSIRSGRRHNAYAMASLPGAAIIIFIGSAAIAGAFGDDSLYVYFTLAVGFILAAVTGLREHSIIRTLRSLRDDAADGKRRLRDVLESTSDSVIVVDGEWRVTFANNAAGKVLARGRQLNVGRSLWSDFGGNRFPGRDLLKDALERGEPIEFEAAFGRDNLWLDVRAFPRGNGMSIFFRDISERRRARLEIENLAFRDTLTGLLNRTAFHRGLDARLAGNLPVGILILDLDHFKEINDTKGHPVGDEVLQVVAGRLRDCVGKSEVARLGGDEFAVILHDYTEEAAAALAADIGASIGRPIHIHDTPLRVGASIGIALGAPGADADILLRNADIALYEVKNHGRGGHAFFRKAMETLLLERNGIKQDLASALENNEFELHYQPLVDLATGRVCSFEALLRWNHPVRGLMPPDTFIPLIEESGLIVPIGAWVMRTACRQARGWPSDVSVAVNISTKQFSDPALLGTIKAAIADAALPANRLELEITESALLDDSGDNLAILSEISKLGHKIALDDFGTGYSSLGYLHKFKFDKLKIDKSFIQGLNVKDEREEIVRTVISLGKTLHMAITAEGVETREQYDWLADTCQLAQGHFISKPLPAERVAGFLERVRIAPPWKAPQTSGMAG